MHKSEAEIIETCARIIAEEGEQNYARATRKALARLNLPATTRAPRHADITLALNRYLALFQAESQPDALLALRVEARNILRLLESALPDSAASLVGAVALGHATAYSAIEIALYVEDYKTLDFFLFDHQIETRIEADGNYHGEAKIRSGHKNKRVIYHVLNTACDVKFMPILSHNLSAKYALKRPNIGHLQASNDTQFGLKAQLNTAAKNALTLAELEALLAAED